MNLSRRRFISGLLAVVSAPAIVRVESLMALPALARIILPVTRLDVLYGHMHVSPEWTLETFAERILAPMVDNLQKQIADTVMYGNAAGWLTVDESRSLLSMAPIPDLFADVRSPTHSIE